MHGISSPWTSHSNLDVKSTENNLSGSMPDLYNMVCYGNREDSNSDNKKPGDRFSRGQNDLSSNISLSEAFLESDYIAMVLTILPLSVFLCNFNHINI